MGRIRGAPEVLRIVGSYVEIARRGQGRGEGEQLGTTIWDLISGHTCNGFSLRPSQGRAIVTLLVSVPPRLSF